MTLRHRIKEIACFGLLFSLSACSMYPSLQLDDNSKKVTEINTRDVKGGWLCYRWEKYSLDGGKDQKILIPVGERVTIGAEISGSDGYMNYNCRTSISFIPQENTQYHANWELKDNKCAIGVYQINHKNKSGIDFERSVQRGEC